MSKKQKKSRPSSPSPSTPVPTSGSHARTPEAGGVPPRATLLDVDVRGDLAAAGRKEGDPAMLVLALIGTTLFIGAYYHLLVLHQMTFLAGGLSMPDSMAFYGQDHVQALAAAMDERARGQLNWVHKTAGVIFPIAVALTLTAVAAWRLRPAAAKWAAFGLALLFVVVDIAENIAIETAINAGGPGAGLAAALTLARWILLALIAVGVVVMLARGGRGRPAPATRAA